MGKRFRLAALAILVLAGVVLLLLPRGDPGPNAVAPAPTSPPADAPSTRRPLFPVPRTDPQDRVPAVSPDHLPGRPVTSADFQDRTPIPPAIRGRVIFPPGEESLVAVVRCRLLGPETPADAEALRGVGIGETVEPRSGYRFTFTRLEPGRYALGISRGRSGILAVVDEVQVGEGVTDHDLTLPPLARSKYVVATVLGPDGAPVKDAEFSLEYAVGDSYRGGGTWPLLPREGGTSWVLLEGISPEARSLLLEVRSPSLGILRAPVEDPAAPAVSVRFREPAAVDAICVEGWSTPPLAGRARLELWPAEGEKHLAPDLRGGILEGEDADIGRTFRVQPGAYELVLSLCRRRKDGRGVRDQWTQLARTSVTLVPGHQEVRLATPPLHTLTVRGATGMVYAKFTGSPRFEFQADVDGRGEAVLDGLPEGDYYLFTGEKGEKRQKVAVPSVSVVQF